MKTTQNQNFLTLYETPGCLWFAGLFSMLAGGIFIYGALRGFADYQTQSLLMLAFAFLFGVGGFVAGILATYRAPLTKVFIDSVNEEVVITKRGLVSKSETLYTFEEIRYFRFVEETDDENTSRLSLGIELTDGEIVRITSLPNHSEENERRLVSQPNEFMHKEMFLYKTISELEGESDEEIR